MATLTQTVYEAFRAGETLAMQLDKLHGFKRQLHDTLRLCETWQERANIHAEMYLIDDYILRNRSFFETIK